MRRSRYQKGCLQLRGKTWVFRYRESQTNGKRSLRSVAIGSKKQYPTESQAWKATEGLRLSINHNQPISAPVNFGALVDRYRAEAMPKRFSTSSSYLSCLRRQIEPRWSGHELGDLASNPFQVEQWLERLPRAQKTKAHLKAIMHRLFEYAMKWRLLPVQRNPMELVEVKGGSKRRKKPRILTVEEFHSVLTFLQEPYRTMVIVTMGWGLRASEVLALQWRDINFEKLTAVVQRAVVNGHVDEVKTECSQDELPLDTDFATALLNWRVQCPPSAEGWVFPSPVTLRPYHASPIQQDYIRAAGRDLGLGDIGWHTFRHTYRSWLDATGAPMGVQQKLMRHAQISTTMNVYGNALLESKRQANSKVVQMLRPALVAVK